MSDFFGGAYARQDSTVSTTPVTLLRANWGASYIRPRMAVITVETENIRYTLDGTTPNNGSTPPVGQVLAAGQSLTIISQQNISQFKAIRAGGSDGVIHVEFFG